jgi:integral membrane protein (TIGR01906 family)
MRIVSRIAQWLFILCLPVLVFTVSVAWAVNSAWLYVAGFEKYHVQESLAENGLPLTDNQLKGIAHEFIHYFNSGEEYIHLTVQIDGQSIELFNREEIIHFKDVKDLFRLDYSVLLGIFLYCLFYALSCLFWRRGIYHRLLARSAIIGSAISLGIMLIIGIAILLGFDSLFYNFHLIAFNNDYWSVEGNMLLLFQGGFFDDMFTYGAIFAIAISLLPGIIGGIYQLRVRRKKKSDQHPQSNT